MFWSSRFSNVCLKYVTPRRTNKKLQNKKSIPWTQHVVETVKIKNRLKRSQARGYRFPERSGGKPIRLMGGRGAPKMIQKGPRKTSRKSKLSTENMHFLIHRRGVWQISACAIVAAGRARLEFGRGCVPRGLGFIWEVCAVPAFRCCCCVSGGCVLRAASVLQQRSQGSLMRFLAV